MLEFLYLALAPLVFSNALGVRGKALASSKCLTAQLLSRGQRFIEVTNQQHDLAVLVHVYLGPCIQAVVWICALSRLDAKWRSRGADVDLPGFTRSCAGGPRCVVDMLVSAELRSNWRSMWPSSWVLATDVDVTVLWLEIFVFCFRCGSFLSPFACNLCSRLLRGTKLRFNFCRTNFCREFQ